LFLLLDLDDTVKDKEAKALEKAKKRALSSSILKELRDEYYEGPEEIKVCK
jgi:U3 small nucleolar ribonucleoprotein protein LCP5